MRRRVLSLVLTLSMLMCMLPTGSVATIATTADAATDSTGLCPHHTEHTEDCGYIAASDGAPCNHEHTEDCYALTEDCTHVHTEDCGYAEAVEGHLCENICEICLGEQNAQTEEQNLQNDEQEQNSQTDESEIDAELEAILRLMEENYRNGIMPPSVINPDQYLSGIATIGFLETGIIPKEAFEPTGLTDALKTKFGNSDNWKTDSNGTEGYDVSGGFDLNKFPDYTKDGYYAASVTVNNAEVTALGLIKRTDGQGKTYIYYMTTDQNESEISAMVLSLDAEKEIKVNYALNDYDLTYDVKMADGTALPAGISVDSVFGGTNPARTTGGAASFDVTIPYGYTAKVYYPSGTKTEMLTGENGTTHKDINDGWPLGTEPVYKSDGKGNIIFDTDAGPTAMRINATFSDDHVTEPRDYVVELTKWPTNPRFIIKHITALVGIGSRGCSGTDGGWTSGRGGDVVPDNNYSWKLDDIVMEEDGPGTYKTTWTFQGNNEAGGFTLDSLAFNGVALEIPFVPTSSYGVATGGIRHADFNISKEQDQKDVAAITEQRKIEAGSLKKTILPDGTVVAIEHVRYWKVGNDIAKDQKHLYTITITGAPSNITITGGNLMMGTGAEEFIPNAAAGIDAANIKSYDGNGWIDRPAAQAVVHKENLSDSDFYGTNVRFKVELGYELPYYTWVNETTNKVVEQGTTVPMMEEDGEWKIPSNYVMDGKAKINQVYGPDGDGWYYIHLEEKPGDENRIYSLNLNATAVKYMVRYMVGSQNIEGDTLTNPPSDNNVENMPTFSTDDGNWDDGLVGDISGNHIDRYDDNGGNFYDRQNFPIVSISDTEPTDSEGEKFFQYWVVVNENEEVIDKDGKPISESGGDPVIVKPNGTIDLGDFDQYGIELDKDIGGTDNNYFVIRLKGVWADKPREFSYEVHLLWTDKEGKEHPAEGEEPVYRIIDTTIESQESLEIGINIDSADLLNWLSEHPTYSLNGIKNSDESYGGYPDEDGNKIAKVLGNYHYEVEDGGRINLFLEENRGALSFIKTVDGDDNCNDSFSFTVKSTDKFTGTCYAWPMEVARASENTIQIRFENGEAKLDMQFIDGVAHLKANGKSFNISNGITLFVPEGSYTISEDENNEYSYTVTADGVEKSNSVTAEVKNGQATGETLHTFVNTVESYELKNAPEVKKTVVGDYEKHPQGDFTFTLDQASGQNYDGLVEFLNDDQKVTVTLNEGEREGTKKFSGIKFNATGTYHFTIREDSYPKEDAKGSYTPVERAKTWTVVVVNNQGKLEVSWYGMDNDVRDEGTKTETVEIRNTYQAKKTEYCYTSLSVIKEMKGRRLQPGGFTFEASIPDEAETDGIKLPGENAEKKTTATNGAKGDVTFGLIEFSKAGEYTVVVKEIDRTRKDVEYDPHELTITYKVVEDEKNNTLVLADGYPQYKGKTTFTNTAFVDQTITVKKNFTGREWQPNDKFTAIAKPTRDYGEKVLVKDGDRYRELKDQVELTFDYRNHEQPVQFDLRFMEAGTYTFRVAETVGEIPGVSYDTTDHLIIVTVADATGKLDATVTVDGNASPDATVIIQNTYRKNEVTIPVNAYKDLQGATLVDNQFSFELEPQTEGSAPEPTEGRRALNDEAGKISWDITFRKTGTYYYTMYEYTRGLTGVTYDTTRYTVVIDVQDLDGNGVLTAEVSDFYYTNNEGNEIHSKDMNSDVPVFTNYAYADASFNLEKNFTGRPNDEWLSTDEFTATVKLTGGNGEYVTDQNNDDLTWPQSITFKKNKTSDTLDLRFYKVGTYTFEVTEEEGNISGVSYDNAKYLVTVTVTEGISRLNATTRIAKNGTAVSGGKVTFANVYNNGNLTVNKKVAGRDADQAKDFTFTVTLGDKSISGTYGDMTFIDGVATFTLKHGKSKTGKGLPDGVTYQVTEKAESAIGYTITSTGATGTIKVNDTKTAEFTNTRDTGNLTISKTVVGKDADKEKDFTFTVTLSDTSINGIYENMTFKDGKATITLKDGESKTAKGLPTGITYTVTENSATGYTTISTGATGTIEKNVTKNATFTNTRDTGDLTVSKTVEGKDGNKAKGFTFTVTLSDKSISGDYGDMTFTKGVATITLKNGESKTATGLPTGVTYKVTEDSADGYTTTSIGETGTIEKNVTKTATFTNSRDTGNLTVSKTVAGKDADKTKDFTFTVTLSETSIRGTYGDMNFIGGKASITLKDGESKTATGLPTGITYTVTENSATGYTTTSTGETGTIEKDVTKTATFTNTRDTGNLTVSKTVAGKDADKTKDFTFTVTLSDTSIGGTYGDMTFTDGEATITLKHGESKTAEGLPTGITYEVEEDSVTGYTTTSTGATGTIEKNITKTVAFTNTRDTGKLTVSKKVVGRDDDKTKAFTFTVMLSDTSISGKYGDMTFADGEATITLKHGESKTAEGLPTGITYEVTEESAVGYTTTSTGATGTIEKDITKIAAFTNTRDTGNLTISKTVAAGDTSIIFTFTVTFYDKQGGTKLGGAFDYTGSKKGSIASGETITLKHGESITFNNLPTGTYYIVTEEAAKDYILTEATGDTGTIAKDVTAEAKFINRAIYDLTVTKKVAGMIGMANQDADWDFDIELVLPEGETYPLTYQYEISSSANVDSVSTTGSLTFAKSGENYTAEKSIQLKHGQTLVIHGLPAETEYKITETMANQDGYGTTVSGGEQNDSTAGTSSGVLNAKTDVEFLNANPAGGVYISNQVFSDLATDKSEPFIFKVTFNTEGSYKYAGSKSGTIKSGDTIELADGEYIYIELLPVGTVVTVEEISVDDNILTTVNGKDDTSDSKTVSSNEATIDFIFTNTRKIGDLTVSKTVTGSAGDLDRAFNFTLELSDKTISGTYGDMTFTDGVATITLKHGESKTATGLPIGVHFTVTEMEANQDGYGTTVSGGDLNSSLLGASIGTLNAKTDVEFLNANPAGGVYISNKVLSDLATDKSKPFIFKVTFNTEGSYTYAGSKNGTIKSGDTIELADGEYIYIELLPVGTVVTVEELSVDEDILTTVNGKDDTSDSKTVSSNEATIDFMFTNIRKIGDLTVSKTVTGNVGERDRVFNFTVELSDATINGTYGDMTFIDGIATITLKHGESKTAEGLPVSVAYTVTELEANQDDYITTITDDNARGTVTASGVTVAFVNSKTGLAVVNLSGTKHYNGILSGEDFEFDLIAITDDAPMPDDTTTGNKADGTFTFDPIVFDTIGTYTYQIKETDAGKSNIIYDTTVYTVDVTVTDVGGKLKADVAYSIDNESVQSVEFTNVLCNNLVVSNSISGSEADPDKEFTFTVTLDDTSINGTYGDMTFINGVATITLKGGESMTATGLPVGITYEVTEEEADQDGYITTVVDDNAKGTVSASDVTVAFVNRKAGAVTISLDGTKILTGATLTADQFAFTIVAATTNPIGDPIKGTQTVRNAEDGSIKLLENAQYTMPGAYIYTISEVKGNAPGYTYDSTKYTVTVTVTDDGTSNDLIATTTITKTNGEVLQDIIFRNTYIPEPTQVELSGMKHYNGTLSGEDFEFELIATPGDAPMPDNTTTRNKANGTFTFDPIGFDTVGTYTYQIKEIDGGRSNIIYDPTVYTVDIEVTDVGGKLSADVTYSIEDKPVQSIEFTNAVYSILVVTNNVNGNVADPDKYFTFTVYLNDAISGIAQMDNEGTTVTYGDMTFVNGVATFVLKDGERKIALLPVGTRVKVVESDYEDYRVSPESKEFTGTMEAGKPFDAAFTNTRNNPDSGTVEAGRLTVTKIVTGKNGETDRAFHFTVTIDGMTYDLYLKHGESWTSGWYPTGTVYAVVEDDYDGDGYTTTVSDNAAGLIQADQTIIVEFFNDRDVLEVEPGPGPNDPTEPIVPLPKPTEPDNSPQTGDNSPIGLWMILMLLSLTGVVVTRSSKRKIK